jgi:hypothetical protein
LPVVARHNAARISLENSGVIGSLGEWTPNISIPFQYLQCKDGEKVWLLFVICNTYTFNWF